MTYEITLEPLNLFSALKIQFDFKIALLLVFFDSFRTYLIVEPMFKLILILYILKSITLGTLEAF